MSNNQQATKTSLKSQAQTAKKVVQARTTDKAVAKAKHFDQKNPKVLKVAKFLNKALAWIATLFGAKLAGFAAAFVTAPMTVWFAFQASTKDGSWGQVFSTLMLTVLLVVIYLWAESSTSK